MHWRVIEPTERERVREGEIQILMVIIYASTCRFRIQNKKKKKNNKQYVARTDWRWLQSTDIILASCVGCLTLCVCLCVFVSLFVSFSSIRHDSRWPSWGLVALKISRLDWNTFYTNISSKINEISTKLAQLGLRLGIGLVLTCPRVSLILSQSQAIYIAPSTKAPPLPPHEISHKF